MYIEEKMINNALCFRKTPDGEFWPYSKVQLSRIIVELRDLLKLAIDEYGDPL